jgi:acetyl-CoA C-acetyltransferase
VEAVRSPLGRRGGSLASVHPADLLGAVMQAAVARAGIDAGAVGQIIAGCVSQVGEQSFNIGRTAWLSAGLPLEVASTTVTPVGLVRASTLAAGLVGADSDVVLSCGVESMSRIPLDANFADKNLGRPVPKSYFARYAFKSQFQGAEMIATEYGITREDTDRFGLRSQELAARAWQEGRFDREVLPIDAPVLDAEGSPTGEMRRVARDEGIRASTLEKLASLKAGWRAASTPPRRRR